MHYLTNILAALFAFPLVLAVYMLVATGLIAKKAKKQQQFVDGADFYKFQVKQKRLGEMRAELESKRDHRKRGPRRKFNS